MGTELTKRQMELVNLYFDNNCSKLNKVVKKVLNRMSLYDYDIEEYYSLASYLFLDIVKEYEEGRDFENFLYSCLLNKFKTELTRQRRDKRVPYLRDKDGNKIKDEKGNPLSAPIMSLDEVVDEEQGKNVSKLGYENDDGNSEEVDKYLNSLSKKQKMIVYYLSQGLKPKEIQEKMNITKEKYSLLFDDMVSFEKTKGLRNSRFISKGGAL